MSYSIEPRKLKKLVQYYYPTNSYDEIKFMKMLGGQQGLLRHLQTSPFQGIDSTSIQQRKLQFGTNQMVPVDKTTSFWKLTLFPFKSLSPKLVFIFSLLTLVLGVAYNLGHIKMPWFEGVGLILFLMINAVIRLVPEIIINNQNHQLKKYPKTPADCIVWRDNEKKTIPIRQLVVGDIVQLEEGLYIGADGLMIEGKITIDEKIGNTKKQTIKRTKKDCLENLKIMISRKKFIPSNEESERPSPIVLGGSTVVKGQGRMMVLCVGKYSQEGYKQMLYHQSIKRKGSKSHEKIDNIVFQFSKSMVLCTLVQVILYCVKHAIFIIVNQSVHTTDWDQLIKNVCHSLTLILSGLPYFMGMGIFIGLLYIKMCIWKQNQIMVKYLADCDTIRHCSTIIYEQHKQSKYFQFKGWWNEGFQESEHFHIEDPIYQKQFLASISAEDFDPIEYGLQIPSFYIGMCPREISFIHNPLKDFSLNNKPKILQSEKQRSSVEIQLSEGSQISNSLTHKYFKGNAQTLIKVCTHYHNLQSNQIQILSQEKKTEIQKEIWRTNLNNEISIISGYIEINPEHPKYREDNSRVVLVAVLQFQVNENAAEFQAFMNINKKGYKFILASNKEHEEVVAVAKQMGIISVGKPSVNLKGYEFLNLLGGILCKNCKKSVCICQKSVDFQFVIKNQDEFSSIHKHLCSLSEIQMLEKLGIVIGLQTCDPHSTCVFGSRLQDIPAMKTAQLALSVSDFADQYGKCGAQIILKSGKLSQIMSLISWGQFTHLFYKKYLTLYLTACIVSFVVNMVVFLVFDTTSINLLQCLWTFNIIIPLLGVTFSFKESSSDDSELLEFSDSNTSENNFAFKQQKQKINSLSDYPETFQQENQFLNKTDSRLIVTQAVFQCLLLILAVLFGQQFIYETADDIDDIIGHDWSSKYFDEQKNTVCWGVRYNLFTFGKPVYSQTFTTYSIYSRHFTFIFNLFVLMQFMNYFLCRISNKSGLNFFEGIDFKAVVLILIALALQILCVEFSGDYLGLYPTGLTLIQWAICFGMSLASCIFGIIMKQLPINEEKNGNRNIRIWPNRAYNLAVKAVAPRQDLIDFEIQDDLQLYEKIKENHED